MIYLNGKKIPYFKITSTITPSTVEVYPASLVYGTDYRSGNANIKDEYGTGFTVDAMTDYKNSTDGEEFFFAPLLTCTTYTDISRVGFTIDLGENQDVGIIQMRIWGVTYDVIMDAEISEDGTVFSVADTITLPPNNAQNTYQFKINNNTRYIRIAISDQQEKWWAYPFIVRSVEVFTPFHKCRYKFK